MEYRKEAETLKLAPGWKWPDSPAVLHFGNQRYEAGSGKQEADWYWFCSWTSRFVDPGISGEERKQALNQVLSIGTKFYFQRWLAPESKSSLDHMLRQAENGNPEALKEYVEVNCPRGERDLK
ncbi:hypothetical protein [Staphylospora marina]|uniref:hypothetical protein n=1 Tax=Staphylospora marina TaxID=2490858 RepID=UPI000F5BF218|nr:hypothetical protein [Staphylospora marina]